jgi:pyruvate kinase
MVDIPGPKIRAGSFGSEPLDLPLGHELDFREGFGQSSTRDVVFVEREDVVSHLSVGDVIHVGDGGVSFEVVAAGRVRVIAGGAVVGKPGLALPSSLIQESLPTPDDAERLTALREESFEILAVSFVRSASDVNAVREALGRDDVMVMAKIETSEAVDNLLDIVEVADAIMVARGDLGVRMPIEDVPHLQKRIVKEGIRFARPVVVATQMLESMTHSQVPTRAEVTDVANAVLDGASAVMLSAETAIGHDPVAVVQTMDRIVRRTEASFDYQKWGASLGVQEVVGTRSEAVRITAAMTAAAWRAATEEQVAAIIACTRSGMTARAISRFRPSMPIIAITPSEHTARQLQSSWGVNDVVLSSSVDIEALALEGIERARALGLVEPGDYVVLMAGSSGGVTDTVRMVAVH